jgi:hypothetical protein
MTQTAMPNNNIHQGRNVKRFREMLGIKQEALAAELGHDWNQIENFDEEQAVNIIANTFHDGAVANAGTANFNCTFNPLDKVLELFERY